MLSMHGGLVTPKCFQSYLVIGGGGGGGGGDDDIYSVCIHICSGGPCTMGWSTIMQQLHSSVVSQQWNGLPIQHLVLIASNS